MTEDPIRSVYSDPNTISQILCDARRMFGSTKTTQEQWDGMDRTLALAYLHCPPDRQDIVLYTIEEAGQRRLILTGVPVRVAMGIV